MDGVVSFVLGREIDSFHDVSALKIHMMSDHWIGVQVSYVGASGGLRHLSGQTRVLIRSWRVSSGAGNHMQYAGGNIGGHRSQAGVIRFGQLSR